MNADISKLLKSQPALLEPQTLKRALKKTLIFERELMNVFGTRSTGPLKFILSFVSIINLYL